MSNTKFIVLFDGYEKDDVAKIEISSGPWEGLIYNYRTVKVKEFDEHATLAFEYDIVFLPEGIDPDALTTGDKYGLERTLGDILVSLIEESASNEDRTNDIEQPGI